jgi:riboflavin synthase
MFTGLVQGTGRIMRLENLGGQTRLVVAPQFPMEDITLGESIAVNGVCLTVERAENTATGRGASFSAYASGETLDATALGSLTSGSIVNLERALAVGDRLGGHLVSGHVDCIATIAAVDTAGESTIFRLEFPAAFGSQVVAKGSVALDGVSLTVNRCGGNFLTVNIIPATMAETTIARWRTGSEVNMETDLIGKYVERMLKAWAGQSPEGDSTSDPAGISMDFLRKHGF